MGKKILKVAFVKNNMEGVIHDWLKQKKHIKLDFCEDPADADYLFLNGSGFEVLKDSAIRYQDKILISITGEAVAPDFNVVDYAIAFDPITYNDRYVKLPIPIFKDMDKKINAKAELSKKTKFCNFIYSHKGAHPNRDNFFWALSKYKKVDSLGEHLKNVEKRKTTRRNVDWFALSIVEKAPYKFSIAFENAESSGYTTEKIQSSMLANTIPIYWGDPEVAKYYNPKSFINCHDYTDFDAVIEKVKELDNDDEKYIKMLSEPWQTAEQIKAVEKQHKDLGKMLDVIFLSSYEEAFRKPVGTWASKYKRHLYVANRAKILLKEFRKNFIYIKFKYDRKMLKIAGITLIDFKVKK